MNRPLTWATLALALAAVSCSSNLLPMRGLWPAIPPCDPRILVTGTISNGVIVARDPLCITLFVTNVTDHDLYVPLHFNSRNYDFDKPGHSIGCHGDSWAASFHDFVLVKPDEAAKFTTCFYLIDATGEGSFSVSFHNNLRSEVKRQLEETGVPYVVELRHDFGPVCIVANPTPGTRK